MHSPIQDYPKEEHPRHIVIKLTKIKETTKEKQQITYKGVLLGHHLLFSRNSMGQEGVAWYFLSDEREKPTSNTLHSKALVQIWWRNQKLYRQATALRIWHHQTSFTTNAKGNSVGGKEKATIRIGKQKMDKLTNKGKHIEKVGSHPHKNILSKPVIMKGWEYKCRIFEIHLKLEISNVKQWCVCLCVYILLYQNLMEMTNQKYIIENTHKKEKAIQTQY